MTMPQTTVEIGEEANSEGANCGSNLVLAKPFGAAVVCDVATDAQSDGDGELFEFGLVDEGSEQTEERDKREVLDIFISPNFQAFRRASLLGGGFAIHEAVYCGTNCDSIAKEDAVKLIILPLNCE